MLSEYIIPWASMFNFGIFFTGDITWKPDVLHTSSPMHL